MAVDPIKLPIIVQDLTQDDLEKIRRRLQALQEQVDSLNKTQSDGNKAQVSGIKSLTDGLSGPLFAYNQLVASVQNFAAQTKVAFDATVGKAAELEDQILGTSTALAGAQKVFRGGIELTDPTEKIKALQPEIDKAIGDVRRYAAELSGVDSSTVIPIFNSIARSQNQINATFADSARLASKFTAAAVTYRIDAQSAESQISQIITGNIDKQNNALYKNLGLSSTQLELYRQQGRAVEYLEKKLETSAAGNKLGAQSLTTAVLNIFDVINTAIVDLSRPLLAPLAKEINDLYNLINSRQVEVVAKGKEIIANVGAFIAPLYQQIKDAVASLLPEVGKTIEKILPAFSGIPDAVSAVFKQVVTTAQQSIGQSLQLFQQYVPIIGQVFDSVLPVVQNLAVGIVKLFGLVGTVLQTTFQNPIVKAAVQTLADVFSVVAFSVNSVITGLNAVVDALQGPATLVNQFFNAVNNFIEPISSGIRGLVAGAFSYLQGIVVGTGNTLIQILSSVGNVVKTVLTPPFVVVKGVVMGAVDAFVMLGKMASESVNAVSDTIKKDLINAINQIPGPVRAALTGLGIIPKGLTDSLDKATTEAASSAKKIGDAINGEAVGAITTGAKEVDRLGSATEQLRNKVIGLQRQYKEPLGSEQLQATAKELVQATADQLKFGQISKEQALAQLEDIRSNTAVSIEVQQQAAQTIQQINQQATSNRLEELKSEQSEVESLVKSGQISELEGIKRTTALKEEQLKEQLENTRQAILDELAITGGADSPRLQQLKAQEKQFSSQIEQARVEGRKNIGAAEIAELETQQQQLNAKLQQGQVNEIDAAKQTAALSEQILQKKIANAVKGSQEELRLTAELDKLRVDNRKKVADAEVKTIEAANKQTQAAIASGTVGALEGEKTLTDNKIKQIQIRLNATQKGTLEEKQLQAELVQAQIEQQKRLAEIRLRLFDAEQKKALDAATSAEKERQEGIQKLINAGVVFEEDTQAARLEAERKRTEQELKLAQERQKQLESEQNRPRSQEEQLKFEADLRTQRIQTQDLTLKLLENQRAAQKQYISDLERAYKRQTDQFANSVEQQSQALNRQKLVQDTLNGALETQKKLLEQANNLEKSRNDLVASQFELLAQGTTDEEKKQKIAQATAALKFAAAQRQAEIERQSLEIQIQQEQAALRRQKIENSIAELKNRADVLTAQANLATTEAKAKVGLARPEEVEAAKLSLQAKIQEGVGIQVQKEQLQIDQQTQAQSEQTRRQQQQLTAQGNQDQALAALLNVFQGPQKEQLQQAFQNRLLQGLGGQNVLSQQNLNQVLQGQIQGALPTVGTVNTGGFQGALNTAIPIVGPVQSPDVAKITQNFQASIKPIEQPTLPSAQLLGGGENIKALESKLDQIIDAVPSRIAAPIVDKLSGLNGGISKLAETPRSVVVNTQEKQPIDKILNAQNKALAAASNL